MRGKARAVCQECGEGRLVVLDTRWRETLRAIYRRRECNGCGARLTTYESVDIVDDVGTLDVVSLTYKNDPCHSG